MRPSTSVLTAIACSFLASAASAQTAAGLDDASQKAVQQTQEMLTSPEARAKALKESSAAQDADNRAKQTLGNQTEAAYALSAKITEKLAIKYAGKPEDMAAAVAKYQSDPHAFMELLGPAEKAEFDRIVRETEKQNPSVSGPLPKP